VNIFTCKVLGVVDCDNTYEVVHLITGGVCDGKVESFSMMGKLKQNHWYI